MRVLIAPDKFKGTLSAPAAALAMAEGVRQVDPGVVLSSSPVADGGGGTLDALLDAVGGERSYVTTTDPWGRRLRAPVALLASGDICLETASAGLGDPMTADTSGIGTLCKRAVELVEGDARVLVAVGGTLSTDGGTGLGRALGWSFLDADGFPVPPGGRGLGSIERIVPPESSMRTAIVALCDVDVRLTGSGGSARCFAPQKGATSEQVEMLERGLVNLAEVLRSQHRIEIETIDFGGAGGGLGAGLAAFAGADLRSGFDFVAEAMRLKGLISSVDFVITGEGRFDEQSLDGKAPVGVARAAHELGIPCLGLFGELASPAKVALTAGFSDVLSLRDTFGRESTGSAATQLASATQLLLSRQPR